MKKIIMALVLVAAFVGQAAAANKSETGYVETSDYILRREAPGEESVEYEIEFKSDEAFIAFKTKHADFIKVRYIDEDSKSAGIIIYIDNNNGCCLVED